MSIVRLLTWFMQCFDSVSREPVINATILFVIIRHEIVAFLADALFNSRKRSKAAKNVEDVW